MKTVSVKTTHTDANELLEEFNQLDVNTKWYTDILREYANKEDVQTVAEFGVFQGISTAAFLSSEIDSLTSMDITLHRIHIPMFHNVKGNINLNITEGDSFKSSISNIDLLFLDTVHTYNHVKRELQTHAGNVNKYILIHDTNYPKTEPKKVRHAIEDIISENKHWTIDLDYTDYTGIIAIKKI